MEIFFFPKKPPRPSFAEVQGLRHVAFRVNSVERFVAYLRGEGIDVEPIRTDEYTGRKFAFFQDPDKLPLELYEV